jgi:DNA (cytosine-5)-methyltransferase 1
VKDVVIDLFSGSGGSALGFQQAGFNIKVAVDVDRDASASFRLNFPNAEVFDSDISYISGTHLLEAASEKNGDSVVLIACPPCQGFSTARRKSEGRLDPRNKLIYEFLRIVEEINPYAFVMENVPGLATGNGKTIFFDVLNNLQNLGYSVVYEIVEAPDYGVPQKRKRLVLIGTRDKKIRLVFPKKTHYDPTEIESASLHPWATVRGAISDLPPILAGEVYQEDQMHRSANLSELNLTRLKNTPADGGSRNSWPEDLVLECHKRVTGYKDVYGRIKWDYPSPTMTGGCAMISKGRFGHPEQHRAISLREAARLQTFPDSFVFLGNFGSIARQIGNAVPPLLAKNIAETLRDAMLEATTVNKIMSISIRDAFDTTN